MSQNQLPEDIYDDGYLRVEHQNYYVACAGTPLRLPRTEFLIFSRLARTPDRIVKAEELWAHVWGTNKPLNTESLHVYMYRLRTKLADHGVQIETMVNVGYRLLRSVQSSPTLADASLHSRQTPVTPEED